MRLFRSISKRLRAARWRRNNDDFLLIFNWHQVAPSFDPIYHHRFTWTDLGQFEAELRYLESQFKILPLQESIEQLKRASLRGPCAALTFDDGDVSMSEHVLPLLSRRRLPATFFINTAYLDMQAAYWFPIVSFLSADDSARADAGVPKDLLIQAGELRRTTDSIFYNHLRKQLEAVASSLPTFRSRLVSNEWLASLDGDQFSLGAHGHEHQRFSMMPSEWQKSDLRENVRRLSQFRAFRPLFAVPFGRPHDWSAETIKIAAAEGLDVVLADGGVNLVASSCYERNPSDGKSLRHSVRDVFSRA